MTVDADMSHIFDPVLDRLTGPALDRLGAGLGAVPGLAAAEREAVRAATAAALNDVLRRKVTRVLVLEVNAARLAGRLTATDPAGRWHQWLDAATGDGFWDSVARRYPTLADRVGRLIAARCAAALEFAGRFAADRTAVTRLLPPGEVVLDTLSFGAGDSHRGGRTVAIAQCATGRLVYKPRSVRVDAALGRLLPRLLPEEPPATRIRVPAVIDRGDYGWAAYEAHRYCSDETELRAFYRGLGHWLAVMLLLGGRDLHAENVIAVGPVPVPVASASSPPTCCAVPAIRSGPRSSAGLRRCAGSRGWVSATPPVTATRATGSCWPLRWPPAWHRRGWSRSCSTATC